jgi:hypothetical protein
MGNLARQQQHLAGCGRPHGHRGSLVRLRPVARVASTLVGAVVLAACVVGLGVPSATSAPLTSPPVPRTARVVRPVVRSYSPAPPAVVAPDHTLTIHGSGFGSAPGQVTVCQFCGAPSAITAIADVLKWSTTVVRVVMPGMQNGGAAVVLITAEGRRAHVGTVLTGVSGPPTGPPGPTSGPPSLRAVFLDYPLSPDMSMLTGLSVTLSGDAFASRPQDSSVTVTTTRGQLLGLATMGGVSRNASIQVWTPWQIQVLLNRPVSNQRLVVTVHTPYGSAGQTVGLPSGVWAPFLVWGAEPAVAAEYFPPGSPEGSLVALDDETAQGRFPVSAAGAEHALPGGKPDPVQLWPVVGAAHWFLWQPWHLVNGTVPAGEYLVYWGRSFPDPLMGQFTWVRVPTAVGGPAAFWHAAVLHVLDQCRAPRGAPPCL